MEIGNGKGPTFSQLSTMALHSFTIDDVRCTSLESFIQSLKFERASQAASVACDKPKSAKERGKKNFNWAHSGNTWWKGEPMARDSAQLAGLVEHVIREVARQCPAFKKALLDTGSAPLLCSGKTHESESPVTESEYARALTKVRNSLILREQRHQGAAPQAADPASDRLAA